MLHINCIISFLFVLQEKNEENTFQIINRKNVSYGLAKLNLVRESGLSMWEHLPDCSVCMNGIYNYISLWFSHKAKKSLFTEVPTGKFP